MEEQAIDPVFVQRIARIRTRFQSQPPDVHQALANPEKPFQLWDVPRQTFEVRRPKGEPVRPPRTPELAPRTVMQERLPATRALVAFVPTSRAAQRAFRGLRALLRSVFSKPVKT